MYLRSREYYVCLFVLTSQFIVWHLTASRWVRGGRLWIRVKMPEFFFFGYFHLHVLFYLLLLVPKELNSSKTIRASAQRNTFDSIGFYCIHAFIDLILLCGRVCHSACSTFQWYHSESQCRRFFSHHAKTDWFYVNASFLSSDHQQSAWRGNWAQMPLKLTQAHQVHMPINMWRVCQRWNEDGRAQSQRDIKQKKKRKKCVCWMYKNTHSIPNLFVLFSFPAAARFFSITLKWCGIFTWPRLLFIALEIKYCECMFGGVCFSARVGFFFIFSTIFRAGKLIFNEQNWHINFTICIFTKPIDFRSFFLLWILNEQFHFHLYLLDIYEIEFK